MKKVIVLFALAFSLASVTASAQTGNGGGERYRQVLKDSLQLTDIQIDTVMAVRQVFQPQMRDIFIDQSASADDKKTRLDNLNQQMMARLKPTLTDDQIQKLEAMQQKMRDRMRNRGGGNQ